MSKKVKHWQDAREEYGNLSYLEDMRKFHREVPPQHREIVYGLLDPRNGRVRYIGRTKYAARRYSDHVNGKGTNQRLNDWIEELSQLGTKPRMIMLEESSHRLASWRESAWIRKARRDYGWDLLNNT